MIWYADITSSEYNLDTASFMIQGSDQLYIKDIRVGSHPKNIAVIVNQSHINDCVITWNLDKNVEKEAFDVQGVYEVLWDEYGSPYII